MRFGFKTLLVVLTAVSIVLAIASQSLTWGLSLSSIIVVNLIGIVVGYFVTHGLNFPTDGGFRDRELRREANEEKIAVEKNVPTR